MYITDNILVLIMRLSEVTKSHTNHHGFHANAHSLYLFINIFPSKFSTDFYQKNAMYIITEYMLYLPKYPSHHLHLLFSMYNYNNDVALQTPYDITSLTNTTFITVA